MAEQLPQGKKLEPLHIEPLIAQFEALYPQEMRVLRIGGVYPKEIRAETINPYTKEVDPEYFGNIGEHCVAVARLAQILATRTFGKNHEQTTRIVSRALVHDATKRFEIMRKKALKAGKIEDAYSPKAYETIREILQKEGVDSSIIDYMAQAGKETGHISFPQFVTIKDGKPTLVTDDLAAMIVHLADDMTYTPIVSAGVDAPTSFVTVRERMYLSDFPNRYAFLYQEGFGFDQNGKIAMVKNVFEPPAATREVHSYAEWQTWISDRICHHLTNNCFPEATGKEPQAFIKEYVNNPMNVPA